MCKLEPQKEFHKNGLKLLFGDSNGHVTIYRIQTLEYVSGHIEVKYKKDGFYENLEEDDYNLMMGKKKVSPEYVNIPKR